jgi:GNAT superfamily N-acetyltransferase
MGISVEPARTRAQLASLLAIGDVVHPGPKPDVAALEHELATEPRTRFLLASLDGIAVATGVGKPSSIGDALYAMVRVLPSYRLQGVGTEVIAELSRHARTIGCGSLIGRLREDDEDARIFVEHRGFTVLSRERPVALDLTRFDRSGAGPPAGVAIVSLAERPDLVEAAYDVEVETIRDIPVGPEAPTARPFAAWHAETIDAPGALPDLSLVALDGSGVIGWSGLAALGGEEGVAENLLTGVRRVARGRGIATALKLEQAHRAKLAGFRRIETTNDEANAPMRAVNARLGFKSEPVWLLVRGPLSG